MTQLSHRDYDVVEHAVSRGARISITRKGREYIVVPLVLNTSGGRESIETRNPVTGYEWTIFLDEIERVEAVG